MLECIIGAFNMKLIWENGTIQDCLFQENYSFKEFRSFINMTYPQVLSEWERWKQKELLLIEKELLLIETKANETKLAAASSSGK